MSWDQQRCRLTPYAHQLTGVDRLSKYAEPGVGRVVPGVMWLADEMRLGKTKQVVDAAQVLYTRGEVDTVIVVCPAPVRSIWSGEFGEIAKHHWLGLPALVTEYHEQVRKWTFDAGPGDPHLTWIVTNYEYIRHRVSSTKKGWRGPNLDPLLKFCGPKTWLVLDESSYIAHHDSLQTKACMTLRQRCGWASALNGTPVGETPEDIFSQAKFLDPRILGMQYITHFRSRYAIMGGWCREVPTGRRSKDGRPVTVKVPTEVVGWRHKKSPGCCGIPPHLDSPVHGPGPGLEEVQQRLAPYMLRRVKKDCLDLPPKLDPVVLTARLTPETWSVYCDMRDETVAWLDQQTVSVSAQAGVHMLRLSQITSGFLGGLVDEEAPCPSCRGEQVFFKGAALECDVCRGTGTVALAVPPREVGREKLDLMLEHVSSRLRADPEMRMLAWCRFRPELERLVTELAGAFPALRLAHIWGGQPLSERTEALRMMHPDSKWSGAGLLAGTLGTGAMGLNMAGAHEVVYVSNDRSLIKRQQSEDRPHGPGQTQPVSYADIVAEGPKGQRTIDHVVLSALRNKRDVSNWTCEAWKTALTQI